MISTACAWLCSNLRHCKGLKLARSLWTGARDYPEVLHAPPQVLTIGRQVRDSVQLLAVLTCHAKPHRFQTPRALIRCSNCRMRLLRGLSGLPMQRQLLLAALALDTLVLTLSCRINGRNKQLRLEACDDCRNAPGNASCKML